MSDARLHTTAPRSPWPRRGLYLARNTAAGFAGGIVLWILALLLAASVALVSPSMGPDAAAGAWQAAWTPSGFLYAGTLFAAAAALLTIAIWWAIDQRNGSRS